MARRSESGGAGRSHGPNVRGSADSATKVTIYEVAARAGVSIATVSHALNRPEKVSASTRDRVLDAVDELGFTPKQTAVSLARKGVGRIAVVGPFSAYPTYFARLLGVLHACEASRYEVVVFDDNAPGARSPLLSSLPATGRIDGLLIMGVEPDPKVAARINKRTIPTVLLDRPSDAFSSVTVNDEVGGRMLAEHLLSQGVRSPAFVSPPPADLEHVTSGEMRMRGFNEAVKQAGLGEKMQWFVTDDSIEGGRAAAADMLAATELPTGVFAIHDLLAAGIIAGLRDAGKRVPEDVKVVGYDDSDLAAALDITTVRQPFTESGRAAAEVLLAKLADAGRPLQQISLNPELVIRSSG